MVSRFLLNTNVHIAKIENRRKQNDKFFWNDLGFDYSLVLYLQKSLWTLKCLALDDQSRTLW